MSLLEQSIENRPSASVTSPAVFSCIKMVTPAMGFCVLSTSTPVAVISVPGLCALPLTAVSIQQTISSILKYELI